MGSALPGPPAPGPPAGALPLEGRALVPAATGGVRRRRILFVELLGGLGDVVIALPAIHALARAHPAAVVEVATYTPGLELLRHDRHVGAVHEVTRGRPDEETAAVERLLAELRPDIAVSDVSYGGIPDALRAGARHAVTNLWRSPGPDERIDLRFLELLHRDGLVRDRDRALPARLTVTSAERWQAGTRLRALGGGRWAMLAVEAGMAVKEWPVPRFRALARWMTARGLQVVVPAGARSGLAERVAHGLPGVVVLPPLPLREVTALAARCDLCVAGDTGLARVAAAVGTPTVALFGPSPAARYALPAPGVTLVSPEPCPERRPLEMTAQPCWWSGGCVRHGRRSCMEDIGTVAVARAAGALLG